MKEAVPTNLWGLPIIIFSSPQECAYGYASRIVGNDGSSKSLMLLS